MFNLSKNCRAAKEFKYLFSCFNLRRQWIERSCQSVTELQKARYFTSNCFHERNYVSRVGMQVFSCQRGLNQYIKGSCAPWMSQRYKQTDTRSRESSEIKSKEYFPLYLCNQVRFLRILCRFAKYSTFLCLIVLPSALVGTQLELISPGNATNVVTLVSFYTAVFTGQSMLFSSKVLCKIMMSADHEHLKLSHISVFGDRRDIYVTPSDVMPAISEGDLFSKKLVSVQLKNNPLRLTFLPQTGGADTNYEILEKLLVGHKNKK